MPVAFRLMTMMVPVWRGNRAGALEVGNPRFEHRGRSRSESRAVGPREIDCDVACFACFSLETRP